MWPYQHLTDNVPSPVNESEEMALSSYSAPPRRPPPMEFDAAPVGNEVAVNNAELQPSVRSSSDCSPVDLLLLKSLDAYVLSVRTSEELRNTRVFRPPMEEVLWPMRRNETPPPQRITHSASTSPGQEGDQSESDSSTGERDSYGTVTPGSPTTRAVLALRSYESFTEGPTIPRRRHRSIQNMPQPSLLAIQVANRVIKYARSAKSIHEDDLWCLDCGLFPTSPVTGKCGHTRCAKCVEIVSTCPCGNDATSPTFVNILIRDLIGKTSEYIPTRMGKALDTTKAAVTTNKLLNGERRSSSGPMRTKRRNRPYTVGPFSGPFQQHIPMSARARFSYAVELLHNGRHKDAAPQLAIAAASCHSELRAARPLLAQVVMVLSRNRDPRGLTRELNCLVRHVRSMPWLKKNDLECILCCDIFTKPVTTPCGHMFCRTCLEKTMDYKKRCPLCLRSLGDFKLSETNDTLFVKSALASINAVSALKPMEDDLVPIFVCTVAYPSVSCPLFIFDPRYWLMIRRVLESGSRRFGMVAMDRDKKYADYGTILEVRDCVHLEDGRSILSTIGLTRFKVIERSVRDGCEVARIHPIIDIPPEAGLATADLKMYSSQIMLKAIVWLSQLNSRVLTDIENAFGRLPTLDDDGNDEWWESSDGPAWLWWMIAVLPLRTEIKVLILSTDCLIKRMMAVGRTLEAIEHVTLTTLAPGQCQVRVTLPNRNPLVN